MMQNTDPMHMSDFSHFGWLARASAASAVRSGRYFVVLMRKAALREQTRRDLADWTLSMSITAGAAPPGSH